MKPSLERAHISGRNVRPVQMSAEDCADYQDLRDLGINISERQVEQMLELQGQAFGMDAIQPLGSTVASIPTPVQFLQNWLPGFVNVITAARKIDQLIGISTIGNWEDEEVVQGIMELTGKALPYGDYNNIPYSSWNANYDRRTVVRFEEGMRVGKLEEARSGRANINSGAQKRAAAAMALDIQRNAVGFYGYNNGTNRTYGFLNDPNLGAYTTVATGVGGLLWSQKTFLEITADIRTALIALRVQSQDTIDPETTPITLAIASNVVDYLSVTSVYGNSVRDWLKTTYPNVRVESAPELNAANGGANVFYIYADSIQDGSTDNGRVFDQIVPSKFQLLGVDQEAKFYIEDYSNATAGVIVKRPFAVKRYSGI